MSENFASFSPCTRLKVQSEGWTLHSSGHASSLENAAPFLASPLPLDLNHPSVYLSIDPITLTERLVPPSHVLGLFFLPFT
jgi:hypothetical protein